MTCPDLDKIVKESAARLHLTVQPCGLNADWSVTAYMLSPGTPNTTQGAYYLIEDEDDDRQTWSLVRRWYEVDPFAVDHNPHKDTPKGIGDAIGTISRLDLCPDATGPEGLSEERARLRIGRLLQEYQRSIGDRKACDDCAVDVFYSNREEQWLHDAGTSGCFLSRAATDPGSIRSYDVRLRRVLYQYVTIRVEAEDESQADEFAEHRAQFEDLDWDDCGSSYNNDIEVQDVEEI